MYEIIIKTGQPLFKISHRNTTVNIRNITRNIHVYSTGRRGFTGEQGIQGPPGENGASIWGQITGTLADQIDLKAALDGKASTVHNHDDRYYTDSEVDILLLGKAAASHVHVINDITNLQTNLDGKVDENAAITGATKTKITYDAKGLVTNGADATTADIADSTDKRYVTDAQLALIADYTYTLPTASASVLGGIKVGSRLTITDGVLSADVQTTDISGKASIALSNLASVAINTSLISDTDSADDLGSSAKYWANLYTDKIYLNNTASLDGSVAGEVNITGIASFSTATSIITTVSGKPALGIGTLTPSPVTANRAIMQLEDTGGVGAELRINSTTVQGRFFNTNAFFGFGTDTAHPIKFFAQGGANIVLTINPTTVEMARNLYLTNATPLISTASNANLSIVPNGTGYTIIGDAGTTSHSFNTNDDLLVSGRLEVDGECYFDGKVFFNAGDGADNFGISVGASSQLLLVPQINEGIHWALKEGSGSVGNNIIITTITNRTKNHDHALNANPTLFIHSTVDPDTNNTQWLSLTHNQTNGVINTGTGNLTFGQTLTSDTDSTDDLGTSSIYWANTYTDKIYLNATATLDGTVAGCTTITGDANVSGVYKVDGVQVVGNRVIDARIDDTPNSGDATTDGIIAALQSIIQTHGLAAAA